MTEWDLAYMRREVKPAPAAPLSDADIDRIADDVPVDQIGVHITTWHRRFARAVLSAAPAVPLTDERIAELWVDILSDTPASGIHETEGLQWVRLARAIEQAHGIGGGK